jgi:hypothetical protein
MAASGTAKLFMITLLMWVAVTTWAQGFYDFTRHEFPEDGSIPRYVYMLIIAAIVSVLLFWSASRFSISDTTSENVAGLTGIPGGEITPSPTPIH